MDQTIAYLFSPALILRATTNNRGEFSVSGPTGIYRLEAERIAFRELVVPEVRISEASVPWLELKLEIANAHEDCGAQPRPRYQRADGRPGLVGVVELRAGSALTAEVLVTREAESDIVRRARTNQKGEFRFDDLPAGRYVARAWAAGHYDARSLPFQVTSSNTTAVRILMLGEGMSIVCG